MNNVVCDWVNFKNKEQERYEKYLKLIFSNMMKYSYRLYLNNKNLLNEALYSQYCKYSLQDIRDMKNGDWFFYDIFISYFCDDYLQILEEELDIIEEENSKLDNDIDEQEIFYIE